MAKAKNKAKKPTINQIIRSLAETQEAIIEDIGKIKHNIDWGNGAFKRLWHGIVDNFSRFAKNNPLKAVRVLTIAFFVALPAIGAWLWFYKNLAEFIYKALVG